MRPLADSDQWDAEVARYEFIQDDLETVDAVQWPEKHPSNVFPPGTMLRA